MSVSATKPAPLALGSRDMDSNRVELLPRKNALVNQLLEEFVNGPKAPAKSAPPPPPPAPPAPSATELAQLRLRMELLENRVRKMEAENRTSSNERVIAVLEQLIAELRERN